MSRTTPPDRRPERGASRWGVLVAAAVLIAVAVVAIAMVTSDDDGVTDRANPRRATASVERTDLVRFEEFDGTLGFADAEPAPNHLAGIVTGRAGEGAAVPIGSALFEVDQRPVLLLRGDVPAFRPLGPGVGDGDDVAQLEATLVELGHLAQSQADDSFTDATRTAIERLQEAAGLDGDGRFELGEVIFRPGPQRVLEHLVPLGTAVGPGVPVVSVAADAQVVTAEVPAADAASVAVGDTAEVELPDGSVAPATVTDVAGVARVATGPSGQPGDPVIDVTLVVDDEVSVAVDRSPVTVRLRSEAATDVLAVPIPALLALAEGGFAVEVVEGGSTRLVGVEIGAFAGGRVEVTGDVDEGDTVVVPRR